MRPRCTPGSLHHHLSCSWMPSIMYGERSDNSITRSLGLGNFVCYNKYFVISAVKKQYKTKQFHSLGPEKIVLLYHIICYITYFVNILSFHCNILENGLAYTENIHVVSENRLCREKNAELSWECHLYPFYTAAAPEAPFSRVFTGNANDSRSMRMAKKLQKSNIRISGSKSLPNMRRGSEAL